MAEAEAVTQKLVGMMERRALGLPETRRGHFEGRTREPVQSGRVPAGTVSLPLPTQDRGRDPKPAPGDHVGPDARAAKEAPNVP